MNPPKAEIEYKLRVPRNLAKSYYVMKLNSPRPVQLSEISNAYLTRNATRHGEEDLAGGPGSGAGSEYGKDKKEETKKKRRGYTPKEVKKEDMRYSLRLECGKKERKFGGRKEGSILENSSYYILTQCQDGVFEAMPIHAWYNFQPTIDYHVLSSDDVEKEFSRRDKTINYHNMMLQKRLQAMEEKDESQIVGEKVKNTRNNLVIHDDEEEDDEMMSSDGDGSDKESKEKIPKNKNNKKKDTFGGRKKKKENNDEENDEVDTDEEEEFDNAESKEFDYMSESSSNDEEEALQDEPEPEKKRMQNKARDDLNTGTLSDSEAEEEDEELTSAGKQLKEILKREAGEDETSEEEDEDEDEDIDESEKYSKSALFMPGNDGKKKKGGKSGSVSGSNSSSRSNTPTPGADSSKPGTPQSGRKSAQSNSRKLQSNRQTPVLQGAAGRRDASADTPDHSSSRKRPSSRQSAEGSPPSKKGKTQKDKSQSKQKSKDIRPQTVEGKKQQKSSPPPPPQDLSSSKEPLSITEATIRRYLCHKPMTTTDLVKKFKTKKTGLTKEQTVSTIASILKKIGPERQTIDGKLYLSIKPSKK